MITGEAVFYYIGKFKFISGFVLGFRYLFNIFISMIQITVLISILLYSKLIKEQEVR